MSEAKSSAVHVILSRNKSFAILKKSNCCPEFWPDLKNLQKYHSKVLSSLGKNDRFLDGNIE
jgi:hypothetical protein